MHKIQLIEFIDKIELIAKIDKIEFKDKKEIVVQIENILNNVKAEKEE